MINTHAKYVDESGDCWQSLMPCLPPCLEHVMSHRETAWTADSLFSHQSKFVEVGICSLKLLQALADAFLCCLGTAVAATALWQWHSAAAHAVPMQCH